MTVSVRPERKNDRRPDLRQPLVAYDVRQHRRYRLLDDPNPVPGTDPCSKGGSPRTFFDINEPSQLQVASQIIRIALQRLRASGQAWVCGARSETRAKCHASQRTPIFTLDRLQDVKVKVCREGGQALCMQASFVADPSYGGREATLDIQDVWIANDEVSSMGEVKITHEAFAHYD